MPVTPEIIRLEAITKRFGGVTALKDVSISISSGEVHAIVGENGAGKSTLMKILAGVHQPDNGQVYLNGEAVSIRTPLDARRHGISIVFQELNLFPDLTAANNVFINRELMDRARLLDRKSMLAETRQVFELMDVGIDPAAKIAKLSIGERQLVEIARTLQQRSNIIIMDEPNSALTEAETVRLFAIIRRLRDQGITIIYVSHRLEEVFDISDRITVIRDGQYQGTWKTKETTVPSIISAMIGRGIDEKFPSRSPLAPDSPVVLQVADLCKGTKVGPISFTVRAGEILGFAGIEGAGVEDLFRMLFAIERPTSGTITFNDKVLGLRHPSDAIEQGFGMIPANRREQGLMMEWTITSNATLVVLDTLRTRLGLLNGGAMRRTTEQYVERLNIATDSIQKLVHNLSGGNQQKIVVAKWLATHPKLLILNDPTRGIDVGAKAEIYRLCNELAEQGLALLFTSSEADEIVGVCDRVLCFYKGRVVKELSRGEATKAGIMRYIAGGVHVEPEAARGTTQPATTH